ncbi:morphogenetic protein [Atlantibacter hermannii]|uniref:morphogenetic protein n=1 Tax=Atlantibacter hermannii TaxID=565 RepID=UPI002896E04B|nr:morphogenetic protein [Atlantibacter hermannii]
MKERGMIFNGEMVRAIIDGRKTQTRRIIKLSHESGMKNPVVRGKNGEASYVGCRLAAMLCPFGKPGDRIWVRETWTHESIDAESGSYSPDYRATANGQPLDCRWIPSIHMPRWASRITLEITDVRVERLASISQEDAAKEGYPANPEPYGGSMDKWLWFRQLWDSIYPEQSFSHNPWVWVIEFKRVEGSEA